MQPQLPRKYGCQSVATGPSNYHFWLTHIHARKCERSVCWIRQQLILNRICNHDYNYYCYDYNPLYSPSYSDLILCVSQVCPGSPPGVWVCSTDSILTIPPDFGQCNVKNFFRAAAVCLPCVTIYFWSACVCVSVMSWEGFSGVRVLALPGDVSYAANHGVYLTDGQVCTRRFEGIQAWNLVLLAVL